MYAFHVRYGWIARSRLAELLGTDPALAALRALLHDSPDPLPPVAHRDLEHVLAFVRRPRLAVAPRRRSLAGAAAGARTDAERAAVTWAADVTAALRDAESADPIPHDAIVAFLDGLATTDFPIRLTFSQPALAAELFTADGRLAPAFRQPGRKTTQAFLTAAGYALGAVGRLSPRDAWIGVGFGVFAESCADSPVRLGPARERLIADPDLAWIDRRWTDLTPLPLPPGHDPWSYLGARVAAEPNATVRERYQVILAELAPLRARLAERPCDLPAAREFVRDAELVMRASVDATSWRHDPHRFWITRLVAEPLTAPLAVGAALVDLVSRRHAELGALRRVASDQPPSRARLPYPLRVQALRPDDVHLQAAEFFDWIVTPGPPPLRSDPALPPGAGAVVSVDECGARLDCVDPNPRRAAERFAVAVPDRPRFCDDPDDRTFAALRPPPIVDNRLVRLRAAEVDPDALRPGDRALAYTSLLSPATAPLLALEVASPRYDRAIDLAPRQFDAEASVPVSFGRVCPNSRIWLLTPADIAALRARVRQARLLAAIYHLEVHTLLGAPQWAQALLEGQRTALYTPSILSWFFLLHELRVTDRTVAVLAPRVEPTPPIFTDDHGQALPAQVIVRGSSRLTTGT